MNKHIHMHAYAYMYMYVNVQICMCGDLLALSEDILHTCRLLTAYNFHMQNWQNFRYG